MTVNEPPRPSLAGLSEDLRCCEGQIAWYEKWSDPVELQKEIDAENRRMMVILHRLDRLYQSRREAPSKLPGLHSRRLSLVEAIKAERARLVAQARQESAAKKPKSEAEQKIPQWLSKAIEELQKLGHSRASALAILGQKEAA